VGVSRVALTLHSTRVRGAVGISSIVQRRSKLASPECGEQWAVGSALRPERGEKECRRALIDSWRGCPAPRARGEDKGSMIETSMREILLNSRIDEDRISDDLS